MSVIVAKEWLERAHAHGLDTVVATMSDHRDALTCAAHRWNQPCYTCARLQRHEGARRHAIWALGHVGHEMTRKQIVIRTPKRRLA